MIRYGATEVIFLRIRTFLKPLSFIPALLLMYMIYSFSAQEGDLSSSVSYKASCVLVEAADNLFDIGLDDYQVSYYATRINGVTRKLAHMTEYFLLAIAVSFPLYVYGLHGILLMILAGGLCIAFACGDEYHQSFVAGRSPSMRDVAIDSIGVFIGIIVVRIIGWTGRMTLFRPVSKDENGKKLSKKQQKQMQQQWEQQMQGMGGSYGPGYPPNGYEPSDSPSQGGAYPPPYGTGGVQGTPPYGGSYQVPPYQNGPYPNEPYSNGPYPENPYPGNGPYPECGPYSEGGPYPENGPDGPYAQGPYPGYPSYQGPDGQGAYGPYPNSYPGGQPYQPQAPQYMGQQETHSSDELSDDMPLSHLLKPKNKK